MEPIQQEARTHRQRSLVNSSAPLEWEVSPFMANLPEAMRTAFAATGKWGAFARGTVLRHSAALPRATSCFLILRGCVGEELPNRNGSLILYQAGDLIGVEALFAGPAGWDVPPTLRCVDDTVALAFPTAFLQRVVETEPAVYRALFAAEAHKRAVMQAVFNRRGRAIQRTAGLLYYLALPSCRAKENGKRGGVRTESGGAGRRAGSRHNQRGMRARRVATRADHCDAVPVLQDREHACPADYQRLRFRAPPFRLAEPLEGRRLTGPGAASAAPSVRRILGRPRLSAHTRRSEESRTAANRSDTPIT